MTKILMNSDPRNVYEFKFRNSTDPFLIKNHRLEDPILDILKAVYWFPGDKAKKQLLTTSFIRSLIDTYSEE